jgi:hypothetical protein
VLYGKGGYGRRWKLELGVRVWRWEKAPMCVLLAGSTGLGLLGQKRWGLGTELPHQLFRLRGLHKDRLADSVGADIQPYLVLPTLHFCIVTPWEFALF